MIKESESLELRQKIHQLCEKGQAEDALSLLEATRSQWEISFPYEPINDETNPGHNVMLMYGVVLAILKRWSEVLTTLQPYVSLMPTNGIIKRYVAQALFELGELPQSLEMINQAIELEPNGLVLLQLKILILDQLYGDEESIQVLSRINEINPGDPQTRFNRGHSYLRLADFERGFQDYEARWETSQLTHTDSGQVRAQIVKAGLINLDPTSYPLESLAGMDVFIYSEQGFGDFILFSRFIACLKQRGARVHLALYNKLIEPLYEYYRHWAVLDSLMLSPETIYRHYHTIAIGSLPWYFGIKTVEDIPLPASPPPPPKSLARIRRWLGKHQKRDLPLIGLTITGSTLLSGHRNRSLSLKDIEPLFSLPAEFIIIQPFLTDEDQNQFFRYQRLRYAGPILDNFADTAALLSEVDLHLSVDTATAHLAGSLMIPVWALLGYFTDWRWRGLTELRSPISPWYPTMRLFHRDQQEMDCQPMVQRVKVALENWITDFRARKGER